MSPATGSPATLRTLPKAWQRRPMLYRCCAFEECFSSSVQMPRFEVNVAAACWTLLLCMAMEWAHLPFLTAPALHWHSDSKKVTKLCMPSPISDSMHCRMLRINVLTLLLSFVQCLRSTTEQVIRDKRRQTRPLSVICIPAKS